MIILARTSRNFDSGLTGCASLLTAVLSRETRPRAKLRESPPSAAGPMQRGGGDCLRRDRNGKWVNTDRARWPQVSRAGPAPPGLAGGTLTLRAVKPATPCSPAAALGSLGGGLGARHHGQYRCSEIREPLAREATSGPAEAERGHIPAHLWFIHWVPTVCSCSQPNCCRVLGAAPLGFFVGGSGEVGSSSGSSGDLRQLGQSRLLDPDLKAPSSA